jgi:hypothetical protein
MAAGINGGRKLAEEEVVLVWKQHARWPELVKIPNMTVGRSRMARAVRALGARRY